MKKVIIVSLMVVAVLAFVVGPVMATKPGTEPSVPGGLPQNPNGFPSGDHDNLLLHGKKDNFTCPEKSFYLEIETCPLNVCGDYPVGTQVEECPPGGYTCELVPIHKSAFFQLLKVQERRCRCSQIPFVDSSRNINEI